MAVFTISCDKNRSDENEIYFGSWKLSQTLISDGSSSPNWQNVSNGYTVILNSDYKFTTSQLSDCISGNYNISNNIITFNYSCGNTTIPNKFKIVMINESFVCLKLKILERCYPREVPDAFSGSFFFGDAQRM